MLQHHLDGELDAATAARLAAHLEVCRACGLEADTYRAIKDALARRGGAPPRAAIERLERFSRQLVEHGPPGGR